MKSPIKDIFDAKALLDKYKKSHGHTHYVFIAPCSLDDCKHIKVFENAILHDRAISDSVLSTYKCLDLYFVERQYKAAMQTGQTIVVMRLAELGVANK